MNLYRAMAVATLGLHVAWLLWVVLGWTVTRGRPVLRWLHIGSLAYGIFITLAPWYCPLTYLEQYLQERAGMPAYETSFLQHYFGSLVYPDVPVWLRIIAAVGLCLAILGIYAVRFRQRRATGGW